MKYLILLIFIALVTSCGGVSCGCAIDDAKYGLIKRIIENPERRNEILIESGFAENSSWTSIPDDYRNPFKGKEKLIEAIDVFRNLGWRVFDQSFEYQQNYDRFSIANEIWIIDKAESNYLIFRFINKENHRWYLISMRTEAV